MTVQYPARLSLARLPTPLEPLDRLSDELGGPRIWIKRDDLTGSVLSGNKVRKLEFTLAQAQADGCDTLITCGGLQSNHCRSTALLGAALGFGVHLILRGEPQGAADGNLLLDYLAGATVSTYPARQYREQLDALFDHWMAYYRARGHRPFPIPTGASDAVGVWGYVAACEELRRDFASCAIAPRDIVTATGSGGTQAGLTVGTQLFGLGGTVLGIAVCDDEAYFQAKVRSDLANWQARYGVAVDLDSLTIRVNDQYVGPGYGVATAAVFETIKRVARLEGVVLDPTYTGKAFHGLTEEIKRGQFAGRDDVVFIHTGGVFGLFPQRDHMGF